MSKKSFKDHSKCTKVLKTSSKNKGLCNSTPVKYNGCSAYGMDDIKRDFTIVVDWLTIHYKMDDSQIVYDSKGVYNIGDVCLKTLDRQTRHFRNVAAVSVKGIELGVLSYTSCSDLSYSDDSCSFKIDNKRFYTGDWYELLCILTSTLKMDFNNVSRLDIALDTVDTTCLDLIHSYFWSEDNGKSEDVHYLGRSAFDCASFKVKDKVVIDHTGKEKTEYKLVSNYKIGMPRSKKTKIHKVFSLYNKTEELKVSGKDYIRDFHLSNLGDIINKKDVYRHEFRIHASALRKQGYSIYCENTGIEVSKEERGVNLKDLTDTNFLCELYNSMLKKSVEFTTHTGGKNVTRRKRYKIFNFSISKGYVDFIKVEALGHAPEKVVKSTVKFLINKVVIGRKQTKCDTPSVCFVVADLLTDNELWDWFFDKWELWTYDFDAHVSFYKQGITYSDVKKWIMNARKTLPNE